MAFDRLFVASQHLLPKHGLTRLAGAFANLEGGVVTTAVIRGFIQRYGVDMSEAAHPDPAFYTSFNEFFTRPLKSGARSICADPKSLACPVDGAISQLGPIKQDRIFQAKGHDYSLLELLGGDAERASQYANGDFATIYLSPKDYHRIHMPLAGTLREMVFVPGELYSVNPATASHLPGLFARNERVICHFDTLAGPMAMILIGATIVGSMETVWHGTVEAGKGRSIDRWHYADEVRLDKGEEMGRFKLGSTVIMLFGEQQIRWDNAQVAERTVRMGETFGALRD